MTKKNETKKTRSQRIKKNDYCQHRFCALLGVIAKQKDNVSVLRLDESNIYCAVRNYIFTPDSGEMVRQLPFRFNNPSEEKISTWTVTELGHGNMQSPVTGILKNASTGDSVVFLMDNMGADGNIYAFKNNSDTTLLVMTRCNFKRSDHCELSYFFVWPTK